MKAPAPPSRNVFRHRAFALFWSARFLLTLGVQIESVTLGWQVYTIARRTQSVEQSAFLVGMLGLMEFAPLFLLTLIAGATADRRDRRSLTLICLALEVVFVGALALLAMRPDPSLLPIFAIGALFGASRAFLNPAVSAMGPMLVPTDELPRAVVWNSLAWQGGSILGPFLGGLLISGSSALAYAGAGAFYLAAITAVLALRANTRPEPQPGSRMALIREGLAYVWSNKIVFGAISLDLFAVLLGGATALLPVFARDVLHVGASGFGILRAGPPIGAVSVALILSVRPIQRRAGLWMFAGVALFGVATLLFAVSRWWPLSVVALAALGGGDMVSVFVRQSLVQIVTPDAMRGRVSAVSGLFVGASNELGEFETGVAARILGPVGAAIFGGVGSLVVTGLWARLFPELRKADRLSDPTNAAKVAEAAPEISPEGA